LPAVPLALTTVVFTALKFWTAETSCVNTYSTRILEFLKTLLIPVCCILKEEEEEEKKEN
jgi:hypothetical protein